jgi:biotin-dependent carboxylase-like uncharacterized protein
VTIEVLEAGALTSVQDAIGRHAWRHLGIPAGGAADPWSARRANRLVGNADEDAVLEITLVGPVLRFETSAAVALAGSLEASLDGLPLAADSGRAVRAGSVLRIGTGDDARGYLAVAGGVAVEAVLGSRSTDLRTGFGGFAGRALRVGDRLPLGPAARPRTLQWNGTHEEGPIRVVPGPHADWFGPEALAGPAWRVSALADRTGARLDGQPLVAGDATEVPSVGLPVGAIQVPPDGLPIVALADRPVTGGYPVPAVVIGADIGRVARLRTGDELRFASVSLEEARDALRRAVDELADLTPLDPASGDELGWAGSHD